MLPYSLIPHELILRTDLSLIERALLPVVIAKSLGWGIRNQGVSVPELQAVIGGDVRQITEGLHALTNKGILQQNRVREGSGTTFLYAPSSSLVEHINTPAASAPAAQAAVPAPALSNNFIDMPNDRFIKLHQDSIDFMVNAGYADPASIFDDYADECRSSNPRSLDWDAHFRTWLRRKSFQRSNAPVNSKYVAIPDTLKPDAEQFKAAKYFYHKHMQINKGFQEPNNMQYEGYQIKLIVDTTNYALEDVIKAVEWLFSPKGDWYRPNVTTCEKLREKMDYIMGHVVSYADAPSLATESGNILDMLENIE